ncbi:MAG: FGGY family carbohydrate kinase, partial [Gemmatimonadota bacterium]
MDIGSSSVRARLYGQTLLPAGVSRPRARAGYGWTVARGAMECDPVNIFDSAAGVIDAGVAAAGDQGVEIVAVAVTTFWHGLLGLDPDGDAGTPLYGWGDARAESAVAELRSRLDEREYHRRTGCFLRAMYPSVKLAWLRHRDPAAFARVARWVSIGEYLEQRLFGVHRASYSIASATGLLDIHGFQWDASILDRLELDVEKLPELTELEPLRGLRPEWRARWPQLTRVPFYPAIGDGACANVGSGAMGTRVPALTIGTSAAVRVLREAGRPSDPPADLWDYLLDGRHRVAGAALSNGGNGLAWLLRTFPDLDRATLDRALAAAEPDSHGLTVVATPVVERRREDGGGAGASVVGLKLDSTPDRIGRAWLESISRRAAAKLERLEGAFGRAAEVRASGGAVASMPGWLGTLADAFDRPVRLTADPEATSRGAAIVAARELGWIGALEDAPPMDSRRFEPDPRRHQIHMRAARREQRVARSIAAALE